MDFDAFLNEIRAEPDYRDEIVFVRDVPACPARYAEPAAPLPPPVRALLKARGIERLYAHQAHAIDLAREGSNVVLVTGTASGKTLAYVVPIIETLLADRRARSLLLFPTKALSQDQFKGFSEALAAAGLSDVLAGVYDGDTPATLRRKLRDGAAAIFTNPDMLHAALMPQHARWADVLSRLRFLVLDELHTYTGLFGSNVTNLLRRFFRLCRHYGSEPQVIACSATIGNPKELAETLTGKRFELIGEDASPRGRRTYVFWNPPRLRATAWRSRRSANVDAHRLMAMLVQHGVPTITFSKAKMTAEMIHRYVCETLQKTAPQLTKKVTPYRGGYRPEERRQIERRLFSGELMGVSTTRALELGIDVGGLDASILVGYPGTLASFFQQSGRAGRRERDSLVVLVGLDTTVNQYVMSHPEYLFGRPVEQAVLDPDNPFVITGHLRCATHELPLPNDQISLFGPYSDLVLRVLRDNQKVTQIDDRWYHAAKETPQHEISLRDYADANVLIEDADSGKVLGEVNKFDAPPILHPDAIYMHLGDTYRVLKLDLEKNIATVQRVEVDYYTQPLGGTDVHHIDHPLREKPFGTGKVFWGEVTAYFRNEMYEKVHFYHLEAMSRHGLDLPTFVLETMALWIVPPETLMQQVMHAGLDAHSGLRGIGYATRMVLPLYMTCDTLDFSHSVGSVNSPWNAIFIYERYPHGLGFTQKAYEQLHRILPAVLDTIRRCECEDGCPCCVGKPLRQYATWNVERGEGSIPSKRAAVMILEGLLGAGKGDRYLLPGGPSGAAHKRYLSPFPTSSGVGATLESPVNAGSDEESLLRLEQALRRRLERMREPQVFHPIEPKPETKYPDIEKAEELPKADVARRSERRTSFMKELRRRIAKKLDDGKIAPTKGGPAPPPGMKGRHAKPPTAFPGRPASSRSDIVAPGAPPSSPIPQPPSPNPQGPPPLRQGDPLAARARKLKKRPESR